MKFLKNTQCDQRMHGYSVDMPLVMHYLRRACDRYRALGPLLKLLDELHGTEQQVGYTF